MPIRNSVIHQSGQTLIETMVGLFILVMGISSAVGLAVYALGASNSINKQIIGAGLAREGIEAVKNMRDTNWLLAGPIDTNCFNFASSTAMNAACYQDWLKPPGSTTTPILSNSFGYNIDPTGVPSGAYWVRYDRLTADRFWDFRSSGGTYSLDITPTPITNTWFIGNYYTGGGATSGFYRRIDIVASTSTPLFNEPTLGPMLIVRSRVWWRDKKCPSSVSNATANTAASWNLIPNSCKVDMYAYLTNWKDYK